MRSSRSPSSILTSELRQSFDRWDVRPDGVTAIGERIGRTHVTPRFRTILLGAFAGVALLLSALGLYASLAHMVRRRQRELGVRMALGADRVAILRMVMRRGMLVSVASLAIGLVVTLATGRLLLRREGYKVDLEAVLQAAAKHGTMIEINASPHRLDLDWIHCKRARGMGIKLVINPDAHSTGEIDYTQWGVDVARRAWLEREHVFNTQPLAAVKKALADRQSR